MDTPDFFRKKGVEVVEVSPHSGAEKMVSKILGYVGNVGNKIK